VLGVEAAEEIPGRGRVGQQLRAQPVHQRHIIAVTIDILQTGAAGEHVVGQVQHMIGLGVGHMHREQVQALVDTPHEADTRKQAVHREQPTERGRLDVTADLVVDLPGCQHRL
jgi:hypothetical protein